MGGDNWVLINESGSACDTAGDCVVDAVEKITACMANKWQAWQSVQAADC
mgnify:FL=1